MVDEKKIKEIKPDRGLELFPDEFIPHTHLIQKLGKGLLKRRGNPHNGRRFESDIQYNSYPDIFPNKFHALIQEAITCFCEIEKDSNYVIDFNYYHTFLPSEKVCKLDVVGCWLAVRYRINYSIDIIPKLFPLHIAGKLLSIQYFFEGDLQKALQSFKIELPEDFPPKIIIPDYKTEPSAFKEVVHSWVKKLKDAGL